MKTPFRRALSALAALLVVGMCANALAFCGFFVSGADSALYNDASQVVLMRKGNRTVMSMSNNYKGPPADFAMVIPVPVILKEEQVKTLPPDVFAKIDALSAPRLVEYWEKDPCAPDMDYKRKGTIGRLSSGARPRPEVAEPDELGVTIEAQFAVGEYTIVILSAKEATGLDTWLRQNKYQIPSGAADALAPYVQQGMKFFVAKVNIKKVKRDAQGTTVLSPIRFDFESPDLRLPVRLGLLNAQGKQDLLVYVLHPESRFEVANYPNVFVPTNIEVLQKVRDSFGAFYTALFDKALAQAGGKAIVTEYSWSAGSCDPCPVPPLQDADLFTLGGDVLIGGAAPEVVPNAPPSPKGKRFGRRRPSPGGGPFFGSASSWVLTRLHTRYSKDTLSEDLVFQPASPVVGGRARFDGTSVEAPGEVKPDRTNNFQGRYIMRNYWEGEVACENPQFNRWGGPGGTGKPGKTAKAATGLGSVARKPTDLAKVVRSPLPALDLPGIPVPKHKVKAK